MLPGNLLASNNPDASKSVKITILEPDFSDNSSAYSVRKPRVYNNAIPYLSAKG